MKLAPVIAAVLVLEAVAVAYFWASTGWDCHPDCTLDQEASGYLAFWILPAVFVALLVLSLARWLKGRGGSAS